MFLPGLVSITFRQLSVTEIIALVTQAGLAAVEWGGDVHAPHGDEAQARAVARMGADAGLHVAAYGSYYRVGHPETGPFEAVLASAVALGAPHIRVWPGQQGSDSADEAYFQTVVADSRRIGDLAQAERIGIVYEFHGNTLTDTTAAAARLLQTVDHANVRSLWQPPRYPRPPTTSPDWRRCGPGWNICMSSTGICRPASAAPWQRARISGGTIWRRRRSPTARCALLEFVQDDAPEAFLRDAATLLQWLGNYPDTSH